MIAILINAVFFCALCAGIAWLQIFLSKREKRWPGLVLPGISVLVAFFASFGVVMYVAYINVQHEQLSGRIVYMLTDTSPSMGTLLATTLVFLLYNIPTVILLAIYASCRSKRKDTVERMSVQDLE